MAMNESSPTRFAPEPYQDWHGEHAQRERKRAQHDHAEAHVVAELRANQHSHDPHFGRKPGLASLQPLAPAHASASVALAGVPPTAKRAPRRSA